MPPHFSAHVCYGQMAGWIRIPLGTKVCLVPCGIVLDGDPPPHGKGHSSPPLFGPLLWPAGPHFTHNPFCRLGSAWRAALVAPPLNLRPYGGIEMNVLLLLLL